MKINKKIFDKIIRTYVLIALVVINWACNQKKELELSTDDFKIEFSTRGTISKAVFKNEQIVRDLNGYSALKGCQVVDVEIVEASDKLISFKKELIDTLTRHSIQLIEVFTVKNNSIRWDMSISDNGNFWTTPIETHLKYPASSEVKFWAPWADPRGDISKGGTDNALIANAIINSGDLSAFTSWADPLESIPLEDNLWHYGAPRYEYENPGILYCPFQGDVLTVPMVSFLETKDDLGLSLVLSPEDTLLDINLETTKNGDVKFSRFNHRMGEGKTIKFSADIVPHQADWRSSFGWTVERYSDYFYPTNPLSKQISGTGAYSNSDAAFDVEKMKKMAFRVNWRASFDFPYMGMFIPPVSNEEVWPSFVRHKNIGKVERKPTSIPVMEDYCKRMADNDFYVLSYFNVTEFGTQIEYPQPEYKPAKDEAKWMDANNYLYTNLADAMLFVPEQQKPVLDKGIYSAVPGKPFFTWEKAVALDPGVKSYQDFLVEQAQNVVAKTPSSYGICIDRMDWTRFYNHNTDDGVSWMGNQPVGSLYMSWMEIMKRIHPIFHDNNKVIYVNNHVKRIEQLKYVDGIFDEFTYAGASLNAIAFLGSKKSTLGWISNDEQLQPNPDEIMQKFLYMGVFPMAPFPGNDHSMRPSKLADRVYLDYGILFNQIRGKEWVLEPHVIETTSSAKVNLFKTLEGYTIPVVHADNLENVEVIVRKEELLKDDLKIYAYYPGDEKPILIRSAVKDNKLVIKAPIKRNCVLLKIID